MAAAAAIHYVAGRSQTDLAAPPAGRLETRHRPVGQQMTQTSPAATATDYSGQLPTRRSETGQSRQPAFKQQCDGGHGTIVYSYYKLSWRKAYVGKETTCGCCLDLVMPVVVRKEQCADY